MKVTRLAAVDEPLPDPWEMLLNTVDAERADRGQQRAQMAANRLGIREWVDRVPEQRGPLDLVRYAFQVEPLYSDAAATDHESVHKKSTQCGWSTGAIRLALFWADVFAWSVLYTFPTDVELREFSRKRIQPVIRASEHLRARMLSDQVDNVGQKQIGQGWISFRGLQRPVDSIDVDGILIDEYDTSDQAVITDTEYRLSGADSADIIRRIGVPSIPGFGIDKHYEDSDQRHWTVRCAACNHWNPMNGYESFCQNVDLDAAALVCAACRRMIDVRGDGLRSPAEWVAAYPDRAVRGYHAPKHLVPGRKVLERLILHSKRTRPDEVEAFHRRDMGEAYAPAEGRLSLEAVRACVRPELRPEQAVVSHALKTMGCCVPGTPITMADGRTRPIEDVAVGDSVRTRRGTVANVTTAMRRDFSGTIYEARVYGQAEPLELTGEHPVWTERGWVCAGHLRVGDRVLTPAFAGTALPPHLGHPAVRRTRNQDRDERMAAMAARGISQSQIGQAFGITQTSVSDALKRRRVRQRPAPVDLEALATVLGYYLAEGSVSRDLRRGNVQPTATAWDFHYEETDLMADLGQAVGRLGLTLSQPQIRHVRPGSGLAANGGTSCSVHCGSPRLTTLLLRLGGRGAAGKRLAPEVLGWPRAIQRRMLMAYLDGDGCWRTPQRHIRRVEAGTASVDLAQQLHAIGVRCGMRMAGAPRENGRSRIEADGLWRRIDSVTPRFYEGEVFNLDVDGDDTYLASYVAVHNCDVASARACNVTIEESLDDEHAIGRKVFVGTVGGTANDVFRELCRLMEVFGVHMCCIDNEPDGMFSRAFAARFPGRVYRADFFTPSPGARKEADVWNVLDDEQFVSLWRTRLYDATFERYRLQRVLLPPLDFIDPDFPTHLGNLYRRKVEIQAAAGKRRGVQATTDMGTGRFRVDYVRTGPEDYAQCEAYNVAAIELYWRRVGREQLLGGGPVPLAAHAEGFLLGDDDDEGRGELEYRPGFE